MKAAGLKQIKTALEDLPHHALVDICSRLGRYKLENKELLTYLVFEASDEQGYVNSIKESLHLMFTEVNIKNLYFLKKNLRKILRVANRFIKYSGNPETEVQVLLYILEEIKALKVDFTKSQQLMNLYSGIISKTTKNIKQLHEDLQYDYQRQFNSITGV